MTVTSFDEASGRLRDLVVQLAGQLPSGDRDSIWELIDVGEIDVAFENFTTQLYEYDVVPDAEALSGLAQVGTYLGLRAPLWEQFQEGSAGRT